MEQVFPYNQYADIPTIDIAPCLQNEQDGLNVVVDQVLSAATLLGFMHIVGHGIPSQLIDSAIASARVFFEQSVELKLRSVGHDTAAIGYSIRGEHTYKTSIDSNPDPIFKEIYNIGPPDVPLSSPFAKNIYPDTPVNFKHVMEVYYREMERVETILCQVLSLALGRLVGVPLSGNYLKDQKGRHRGLLRINYYPQCNFTPKEGALRDGAHTDWSSLTILFVEKEALEVEQDGQWKLVPLKTGALIINIGDQLHWWSNGHFKSSKHRVNANHCIESSRVSFAYFGNEAIDRTDDTMISPLCLPGEAPRFGSISIRDYLLGNFHNLKEKA